MSEGGSEKRLQSLLVHLGPGNVSSSHVLFQLFLTEMELDFFFPLHFFLSSIPVLQAFSGEKKLPSRP